MASTVTIEGNLVNDFQIRAGNDGKPWATARLAVNPGKDAPAVFFNLSVNNRAVIEALQASNVGKGTRVVCSGRLGTRSWTDQQGTERVDMTCYVDSLGVALLFQRVAVERVRQGEGQGGAAPAAPAAAPVPQAAPQGGMFDTSGVVDAGAYF